MAIARDSSNSHQNFNDPGPQTYSFTNTAGNLLLVGVVLRDKGDTLTGITYGGVAMTLVDKVNYSGTSSSYLYYLLAPATGANNVVISYTGTGSDASRRPSPIRALSNLLFQTQRTRLPEEAETSLIPSHL